MIHNLAILLSALGFLVVAAIVLAWTWAMGVFAVAPRQMERQKRVAAIQSPPPVTVLDGVVIPRRKGIES